MTRLRAVWALLAGWVRDVDALADARDEAVAACARAGDASHRLAQARTENERLTDENARLRLALDHLAAERHAADVELSGLRVFVAALGADQLPEVPK